MVALEGDLRILFLWGCGKLDKYFFSLQKTIIYSHRLLKNIHLYPTALLMEKIAAMFMRLKVHTAVMSHSGCREQSLDAEAAALFCPQLLSTVSGISAPSSFQHTNLCAASLGRFKP